MTAMIENLSNYQWHNEEELLSLGLKCSEEPTTDSVRRVDYHRRLAETYFPLPAIFDRQFVSYGLEVRVRFELYISDEPHAPTMDNFVYSFTGIFIAVTDDNGTYITEFETKIRTMADLRTLLAAFPCK